MNSRKIGTLLLVSPFLLIAAAVISKGQSGKNSSSSDVHKAVLARLAEIQSAAQALDPDKVFSFVMENDQERSHRMENFFLLARTPWNPQSRVFSSYRK